MFWVPLEKNAPFCNPICITTFFEVRKNIILRGFECNMSSFLIPRVAWTVGNLIQMIFKAFKAASLYTHPLAISKKFVYQFNAAASGSLWQTSYPANIDFI